MDGIKPWVSTFVSKALGKCIVNPKEGTRGPSRRDMIFPADDDGSNVRIAVRTSQGIQLVQWTGTESPVRATLSDSVTLIHAIFSREAIDHYEATYKKNVRNETKGAFLRVKTFEIVVSHSTRAHPPSLYVQTFELVGCEGSGTFGNPTDIANDPGITHLVQGIRNKWSHGDEQDPGDSDNNSDTASMRSQEEAEDITHEEPNDETSVSQEVMSTQIPARRASARRSLPQARKVESERLIRNFSSKDSPVNSQTQVHEPRRPKNPSPSKRRSLAAASTTDSVPRKETSGQSDRGHLTPRRSPALNTDAHQRRKEDLPVDKGSLQRTVSQAPRADKNSNTEHGKTNGKPDTITSKAPRSSPHEGTTCAKLQAEGSLSTSEHADKPPSSGGHTKQKHSNALIDSSRDHDPWKSWTRIRRRDTIISKDQEDLFAYSRSDAWIPPEPGRPAPHAHVPVKLLEQWNDIHTRQFNAKEPTLPQPKEVSMDQEQETPSPGDSSPSSSPIDESEWPASESEPEKNMVPADSSPPRRPSPPKPSKMRQDPDPSPSHNNLVSSENRNGTDISKDISRGTASSGKLPQSPLRETAGHDLSNPAMESFPPVGSGIVVSQEPDISLANTSSEHVSSFQSTQGERPNLATFSETAGTNGAQDAQPLGNDEVEGPTNEDVLRFTQSQTEVLVPATAQCGGPDAEPQPRGSGRCLLQNSANIEQSNSELDNAALSKQAGQFRPRQHTDQSTKEPDGPSQVNTNNSEHRQAQSEAYSPPSKRRRVDSEPVRPSKRQRSSTDEPDIIDISPARTKSLDFDKREAYFSGESEISPGRSIYHSFKQTYRQYDGDITTFKRSCRSLQSLRDQGNLKRSVLWDDYVCRERIHYNDYLLECFNLKGTPETYQTWFLRNVTFPEFKKRHLTVKKIAAVVDDSEITLDEEDLSQNQKERGHSPENRPPHENDLQCNPGPSRPLEPQYDSPQIQGGSINGHRQTEERANGDKNSEDGGSEDAYDVRSQGYDENHDVGSIILGDPEPTPNTPENKEGEAQAVIDLNMDDADSVSSDIDESFAYVGAAKQEPAISEDMSEIQESDPETTLVRGGSAEIIENSPKRHRNGTAATGQSHASPEKPASSHRHRERTGSPFEQNSVSLPHPPPKCGPNRATVASETHAAVQESVPRSKNPERAASSAPKRSRHPSYSSPKRSKKHTTTNGNVHVPREQPMSRGKAHRRSGSPAVKEPLYPPYKPRPRSTARQSPSGRPQTVHTPWQTQPNTPFKAFARAYSSLRSELGRLRQNRNTPYPPVNEEGVIIPQGTPSGGPSGGRMSSMGWSL